MFGRNRRRSATIAQIEAVRTAWHDLLGPGHRAFNADPARLVTAGWTPDDLAFIGSCAEHSVRADTAAYWAYQDSILSKGSPVNKTAAVLMSQVSTWTGFAAPLEPFHGWLRVAAGAPTTAHMIALTGLTAKDPDGRDLPFTHRGIDDTALGFWQRCLGPDLAPLAFAAGLTLDEARHQVHTGTLEEPVLRAMAALAGWRIPA